MKGDPDFSQVTFKANTSGSWCNLGTCDVARIDDMKQACEAMAKVSTTRIKFKYVDAAGGTCELFGRNGGETCWHAPK